MIPIKLAGECNSIKYNLNLTEIEDKLAKLNNGSLSKPNIRVRAASFSMTPNFIAKQLLPKEKIIQLNNIANLTKAQEWILTTMQTNKEHLEALENRLKESNQQMPRLYDELIRECPFLKVTSQECLYPNEQLLEKLISCAKNSIKTEVEDLDQPKKSKPQSQSKQLQKSKSLKSKPHQFQSEPLQKAIEQISTEFNNIKKEKEKLIEEITTAYKNEISAAKYTIPVILYSLK